jgi:hypothetical protein
LHSAEATWRMHALSGTTSCAFLKKHKKQAMNESNKSHLNISTSGFNDVPSDLASLIPYPLKVAQSPDSRPSINRRMTFTHQSCYLMSENYCWNLRIA